MYSRPQKKNTENESELSPLVTESPAGRIRRVPTNLRTSTGIQVGSQIDNRQQQQHLRRAPLSDNLETGDQVGSQTIDNHHHQQLRRAPPNDNLEESHPRFGPLYIIDQLSVQGIKNRAWNHVVTNTHINLAALSWTMDSGPMDQRHREQEAELKVKEIYSRAIRKVKQVAKEMYNNNVVSPDSKFMYMMIEDGCFFLQLALLILGCSSEQLGYHSNDPIFGNKKHNKELKKWIEAMFYPGNQIPLVVLRELMSQDFFREVIRRRKWDTVPQSLCERVLYEALVLPVLNKDHPLIHRDILHALQNLVIGPDLLRRGRMSSYDDHIDLEKANKEEIETDDDDDDGDDDDDDKDGGRGHTRLLLDAFKISVDDRKRVFRSATELERAGIYARRLESSSGGSRSICFERYYHMWAYLHLPIFRVDDYTETIFRCLKTYEACHEQSGRNNRDVSSYLRVMSDIIQTRKDAILMKKRGIIQGYSDADDDLVEKLPAILRRLSLEDVRLTPELSAVRKQIRDYSCPWVHYKGIISLVALFTFVQTIFAVLAYFRPPPKS